MRAIRKFALSAFVAMATLLPNSIEAQTHYSSNVAVGVKGGMDFSEVFFNPNVRQKLALGITGGVMFRYIEEDEFGLIAELNFAQRGWSENFEDAQ